MHALSLSALSFLVYTAIEDLLESAKSLPKDSLAGHFDLIAKDCHSLQRLVSDATLYLTAFELRTAQEVCIITECTHIVILI